MAQKNITYDIGGKTKEASGSYYDDVSNTLVVKNLTVNEISLPNLQDGIAFVSGTVISSSGGAVNGKVVTWDATAGRWGFTDPVYVDVNVANPAIPAGSDVSGSFSNTVTGIQVKSLSNVNTGTPLPVSRGGTGLNKASIPNGESLLIGNGSDALTFLTASNSSTKQALLSNGTGWELTTGPADMTSSVEISIFTSSATWTRPAGTKAIRVLAQGGGGGGGSGANRNSAISATGGSGGAAGGFIDSGIFLVTEDSVPVVVGKGGKGAVYPPSKAYPIELMHFDNLTSNINSSTLITLSGDAALSNTVGKFNNTSLYFPGEGKAIIPNSTVLAGDFTIEFWVYVTAYNTTADGVGNSAFFMDTNNTTSTRPYISIGTTGLIQYSHSTVGFDTSTVIPLNTWKHIALCRSGSTVRLFVDGVLCGSVADSTSITTSNITLGSTWDNFLRLKGHIDEFVVYKHAKYVSNFTPETVPYTDATFSISSAGLPGGIGFGTHFGRFINSEFYLQTYFVNKGLGGTLNSSTAVAGGASITYGADWRGPDRPVYNVSSVTRDGSAGGSATSTIGSSITWATSSTTYYGAGGGAGGGGLGGFKSVSYGGGNGGTSIINGGTVTSPNATNAASSSVLSLFETNISNNSQANNLFVSSGGGGGGGAEVSSEYTVTTNNKFIAHMKSSDITGGAITDSSLYKNIIYNTSPIRPIASPVGVPGTGFTDNTVLYSVNNSGTPTDPYAGGFLFETDNFTVRGWYYLTSYGVRSGNAASHLMVLGGGTNVMWVGVAPSTGRLRLFCQQWQTTTAETSISVPLNTWFLLSVSRTSPTTVSVGINNNYNTLTIPNYSITGGIVMGSDYGTSNFIGYMKEFIVSNLITSEQINTYRTNVLNGTQGPIEDPVPSVEGSSGGVGSNGAWGSGGGGGGASTNYTASTLTAYDTETLSLRHFDLSEATPAGVFSPWGELAPDRSIYRNAFFNGTQNIVSTGSVGIPAINSLFPDGVLSSSAYPMLSSGWDGCFVTNTPSTTDNFTIESWFYLTNYGTSGETNAGGGKCYLLGDGYNDTTNLGVLLGINVATNGLFIWTDGVWRGTGSTLLVPALNTWNHVVLQKQGGTILMYLNGTGSSVTAASTVADNAFGYSLSRTKNTQHLFNGFAKEFMVTSRVKSASEIQNYYTAVSSGLSGSYPNPVGVQQGGDGGDGYVAVISYKY